MIKIYRKTSTIKAEQFSYEKWVYMRHDAYPMVFGDTAKDGGMMATNPFIKTLEGNMKIKDNDWIATGVNGEHWAIADDVFKKTYAELPVIPKAVAAYIKKCKHDGIAIASAMDEDKFPKKVADYFRTYYTRDQWIELQDTFVRAWLDGYQTEGDKGRQNMIDTSKVKGYLLEYPDKESFPLNDKVTINFKSDVAEEGFYSEEDFDSRKEFEDMVKSLYVDSNSVFNGSKITFLVDYKEIQK